MTLSYMLKTPPSKRRLPLLSPAVSDLRAVRTVTLRRLSQFLSLRVLLRLQQLSFFLPCRGLDSDGSYGYSLNY